MNLRRRCQQTRWASKAKHSQCTEKNYKLQSELQKQQTYVRCIKHFKWPTFWKPLKLCALTLGFFSLIFWLYRALCKVAFSRIENVLGNKCNTISANTMKNSKYTSFILKRKKTRPNQPRSRTGPKRLFGYFLNKNVFYDPLVFCCSQRQPLT